MTENKKTFFELTEKQSFLLKSFVGGLLIVHRGGFSGSEITLIPAWIAFRDFISHFSIVFIFWLIIPERYREKGWIWAGLLGSLIFASGFFIIANLFYSLPISRLSKAIMVESIIFSGLGAIPQWFILRRSHKRASLWIVANVLAYSLLYLFSTVQLNKGLNFEAQNLVINEWIRVISYSLPFYTGHGLFGLTLGLCLSSFFEQRKVQEEN